MVCGGRVITVSLCRGGAYCQTSGPGGRRVAISGGRVVSVGEEGRCVVSSLVSHCGRLRLAATTSIGSTPIIA